MDDRIASPFAVPATTSGDVPAPTRSEGHKVSGAFGEMFEATHPAAVESPKKNREALLTFYDFLAEH